MDAEAYKALTTHLRNGLGQTITHPDGSITDRQILYGLLLFSPDHSGKGPLWTHHKKWNGSHLKWRAWYLLGIHSIRYFMQAVS